MIKKYGLLVIFILFGSIFSSINGRESLTKHDLVDNLLDMSDDLDFDKKISLLMKIGHMPSLSACIVKNNTVVWSDAYGYCDIKNKKTPNVNNTVYPIASVSKSVTATAIMQLYEQGLLDLDDNVSKFLPFDLKNPKYPDVNITFRMLLAHQSSISDGALYFIICFSFLRTPYEWFDEYFTPGGTLYRSTNWGDYAPGEKVWYTSTNTEVLSYLVEQISGQPFDEYCQEHIFRPLNMTKTGFHYSNFDVEGLSVPYVWLGLYLKLPFVESCIAGGGGILTTISDLSHYLIMRLNDGVYDGIRILNKSSIDEMYRIQYPDSPDGQYANIHDIFHGLGWYSFNKSDGELYGGHGGTAFGSRAELKIRYSDKVGVIYFWNENNFVLHTIFKTKRRIERNARYRIENLLFEKADDY